MKLTPDLLAELIGSAIENKYDAMAVSNVRAQADAALSELGFVAEEKRLIAACRPATTFSEEIRNQVIAYLVIERFWRHAYSGTFLEDMHTIIYGGRTCPSYRTTTSVPDFSGMIPTPVAAIPLEVRKLDKRIAIEAMECANQTLWQQALFLARVFADIIKVHPFVDGNGRTARMAVQFCLRRWDQSYVVIPKVRNAATWKVALMMAIEGNYDMFASEMASLMANVIGGVPDVSGEPAS